MAARFLLACTVTLSIFRPALARGGEVSLAWDPSFDPRSNTRTVGYTLHYGLASGAYTSSLAVGMNRSALVTGLTPGLEYYFALTAYDAKGVVTMCSGEVTNRLPAPPSILTQPLTQTGAVGAAVTLAVIPSGDPPLSFQWLNGLAPIPGATASVLSWPSIGYANAGNYAVLISNPWGSITSSVAVLSVMAPPLILAQPQSQTVTAGTSAAFSSAVSGDAPLSIQWYCGGSAIAGATSATLGLAKVTTSNSGNYGFTVSNAAGAVASSVATLTVLSTNAIAAVSGAYNGLFYQTNADGTPAVTEATAGFLGNCVVNPNGAFSAKLYVGGLSYPLAGTFSGFGCASVTIPRAAGLSNLTAVLQLDLIHGTRQMTGAISSAAGSNAWTAPLLADLATNALPNLIDVVFLVSAGLSANSPTSFGFASGAAANSVVSLYGALGDTTAISQTVPISKDGNVPFYVSLYNNTGLVEGWIHVAGGVVTGNLTWIRPSGVLLPAGYPMGFDTVAQVSGSSY